MTGFVPPVYPYDRLVPLRALADKLPGGVVDLSVGTPSDPPPQVVLDALTDPDREQLLRGYPPSIGTGALRQAASEWMAQRLGVPVPAEGLALCIGTKEFVAGLPQWLRLRDPARDTVLYPAVSYPTYEMGAVLASLRAVAVPVDEQFRLDLSAVSRTDAERAVVLWVNSPGNPAGQLDNLAAAAAWGRRHGVLVASDECYSEYTWSGPPRSLLAGADRDPGGLTGLLALHSLSKRSNLAGLRVGWYAGDPDLVAYLREIRKHAGFMVPGPAQLAALAALGDQNHVEAQRARYWERLTFMQRVLQGLGLEVTLPEGGFYLWVPAPGGDAWGLAERLAREGGVLVSPGDFYGRAAAGHVRVAMVASMARLEVVARRLGQGA